MEKLIGSVSDGKSFIGFIEGLKSKKFWAVLTYFGLIALGHYMNWQMSAGAIGWSAIVVCTYIIGQSWVDSKHPQGEEG